LPTTDTEISIRQGRADEAAALAKLHVDVWRATYRNYTTPEALSLLDEAKRLPYWRAALSTELDGAGVLVAEQGGILLGVISYGSSRHEAFEGRTEIKHFYVTGSAQGRGIGQRLLKPVLDDGNTARQGVALAVVRQNERARRFYAKMGGVEIGAFTDPGPLWRSENVVVAWD